MRIEFVHEKKSTNFCKEAEILSKNSVVKYSKQRNYKIQTSQKCHEHQSNNDFTLLWDMPIYTDKSTGANKPDIIIKDKKGKSCMLINIVIAT